MKSARQYTEDRRLRRLGRWSKGDFMRRLLSVLVATAAIAVADNPDTNIPNVDLPGGYLIEALTRGLDFPTAIAFSSDRIWVSEAGFLPGTFPKIKEISASGTVRTILSGEQIPAM